MPTSTVPTLPALSWAPPAISFEEAPDLAVEPQLQPQRTPRRYGTMVVAVSVLTACMWLIGGFWASVQVRSPRSPYPSPVAGEGWVRSPEAGPRAFFRLSVPIGSMPGSATLWVDGDQVVTAYIDGFRLAAPTLL